MIAFFEGIDIWKTNEFLAVQREFEKGLNTKRPSFVAFC